MSIANIAKIVVGVGVTAGLGWLAVKKVKQIGKDVEEFVKHRRQDLRNTAATAERLAERLGYTLTEVEAGEIAEAYKLSEGEKIAEIEAKLVWLRAWMALLIERTPEPVVDSVVVQDEGGGDQTNAGDNTTTNTTGPEAGPEKQTAAPEKTGQQTAQPTTGKPHGQRHGK